MNQARVTFPRVIIFTGCLPPLSINVTLGRRLRYISFKYMPTAVYKSETKVEKRCRL